MLGLKMWRQKIQESCPTTVVCKDKPEHQEPSNLDKDLDAYLLWSCLWDMYPFADSLR